MGVKDPCRNGQTETTQSIKQRPVPYLYFQETLNKTAILMIKTNLVI